MRSPAVSSDDFFYARGGHMRRRRRAGLVFGALAALGVAITILAAVNGPDASHKQSAAAVPPAPPPRWIDVLHPIRLFDLAAPELGKLPLSYEARRNRLGGGRQDTLTFGAVPGGETPYIRLRLYRLGLEGAPAVPLYVDLVRFAAEAGLSIDRSAADAVMPTRFGAFEVADVSLSNATGAAASCLGFSGQALAGKFRFLGLACGSRAAPMSRQALACLLDRLDLNEAGDDHALAAFFAASELRRNPACSGTILTPTATHASWLRRHDAPPPLRAKKPLRTAFQGIRPSFAIRY